MQIRQILLDLLEQLEVKYPTRELIAEALGVKYITVAHWYSGHSYPSFESTIKILDTLGVRYE